MELFKTAEEMEQVKDYKYQYMLGDDMVVAPVIRKGKVKQTLYLPAGEWISIWDDLRKGQAMTFMFDLYSIKTSFTLVRISVSINGVHPCCNIISNMGVTPGMSLLA